MGSYVPRFPPTMCREPARLPVEALFQHLPTRRLQNLSLHTHFRPFPAMSARPLSSSCVYLDIGFEMSTRPGHDLFRSDRRPWLPRCTGGVVAPFDRIVGPSIREGPTIPTVWTLCGPHPRPRSRVFPTTCDGDNLIRRTPRLRRLHLLFINVLTAPLLGEGEGEDHKQPPDLNGRGVDCIVQQSVTGWTTRQRIRSMRWGRLDFLEIQVYRCTDVGLESLIEGSQQSSAFTRLHVHDFDGAFLPSPRMHGWGSDPCFRNGPRKTYTRTEGRQHRSL